MLRIKSGNAEFDATMQENALATALPWQLTLDRGTLLLNGPQADELQALFPEPNREPNREPIWVWDPRIGQWRAKALFHGLIRQRLQTHHIQSQGLFEPIPVAWPELNLPALRGDQLDAVEAWWKASACGQIIMPTGTGKTEVALAAMIRLSLPTLIVAPVRDLMYQWHQRILRRTGYDAGILGDSHQVLRPVTVTTYDSATIHMPEMGGRFELLIFDEEHHLPGRWYREAAELSPARHRLGLTATPHRADGRHVDLDYLVGPVVYNQPLTAAAGKTLADYQVVRIPVALQSDEQERYDQATALVKDFMYRKNLDTPGYRLEHLCADAAADPEARRVQQAYYMRQSIEDRAQEKLRILEDLFCLHAGERLIVFAGSNAMAMEISRRFLVPTLLSHSRKKERQTFLEGFARGEFPVLVANQVLDEGVDVPEAKIAIVVGGQASSRQAKQRLGRILRPCSNLRATLYEVVCENTREVERSRSRRRSDAFKRTRTHQI